MRVLHILDSLNRGGAEMHELDVCRNAKRNGLDLVFAATGGGTLEEDFRDSGVDFFRMQRRLPFDPLVVAKLRSLIKTKQIDIIHSHQAVCGIHAYFASIGTAAKHILSFSGHYSDAKNRMAVNFLYPRMDANVVCSFGLMKWLAEIEKIEIGPNFKMIYYGVDTKRLEYKGESLKKELNLGEDSVLIGMVSHFYAAQRKDQITLCRAFAKIAKKESNAHLVLVGRTEKGAEKKLAECVELCIQNGMLDRVHFLGQREDLPKIVSSLDLYVFSSLHEGLPIALMEAMLSRKACILSDIPPHVEVSNRGEYAELFETQNAEELAKQMQRYARDANLRRDLGSRAYGFANENFTIEAHIKKINDLYRSLMRNETI